jgi:methylmalonyl-CoA/ethylmalonyl-CoA epimerase
MRMRLEHVGIVVKDIDAARAYYADLYGCVPLTPVVDEPAHEVRVQLLDAGHGAMPSIELVEPAGETSRVAAFLKKTGGGLHHLAYAVADLDAALAHLKSKGAMPLGAAVPGAAHKVRTAWLFTPGRELIELIELPDA